jgi:hypothetical protein
METVTCTNERYGGMRVFHHDTEFPDRVARLAEKLLDKALITAADAGEDSSGRAKMRPAEAREIIEKVFDIATAYFEVARERGHLIAVPEPTAKD